jgi:hypothetical protein
MLMELVREGKRGELRHPTGQSKSEKEKGLPVLVGE